MNPADLYLRVREKEGRLYPDDVLVRLPEVPNGHPLASEWRARAASSLRLRRYLASLSRPLVILELGCGNGWLSRNLSYIAGSRVWGLDRSGQELAQAARLFGSNALAFLEADVYRAPFAARTFDAIVLASALQYFPDPPALFRALRLLLNPLGEIHLLDSPLYKPDELLAARERTRRYYASLGFPEMAEHYHHHPLSILEEFSPRWLYRPMRMPDRLVRLLGRNASPFPWIVLR